MEAYYTAQLLSGKNNTAHPWIDYKKAFHSVPHTCIIKSLELYKICPTITPFMQKYMKLWKMIFHLGNNKGMIQETGLLRMNQIFQ